jgi:ABC-type branched-subunit amino acid transport system substrate-binding protein
MSAEALSGVPTLDQLKSMLGVDPKYSGKGLTLDCGLVFPLTGFGAIYGTHMMDLPHLAIKHIKDMGGPTFNLIVKDNKSGDPDAGVEAVRELGAAHVGMELASYAADLGSMIPGINKFKLFSLDGTGGTALFAVDKPYFWGTIAKTPTDAFPGLAKYLAAKMPGAKRAAFCGWDLGPLTDIILKDARKYLSASKIELVADERTAISETDYSSNIQKIKASNPDVIFIAMYTEDPGYFMKQYALSGINKPVFTFADTIAARQVAGTAYNNLYFAFDYFDGVHPTNPWAKFYVSQMAKIEPGFTPDFYSANTYEDFFTLWDCVRRVLKKGGNPKDGAQLDAALQANPTFKSLYGGTSTEIGTMEFNLADHSVKRRPMRILQFRDGTMNTLATFDIGGKDFRLV